MDRTDPKAGKGNLKWNAGGWWGTQLGASCWMLALGLATLARWPAAGAATLGAFLLANLVGVGLWRTRDRVAPLPAMLLLLGTLTLASACTLAAFDLGGALRGLEPGSTRRVYLWLLLYPGLALQLALIDRVGRPR